MVRLVAARSTTCEAIMTSSRDAATPTTPVRIGRAAAQPERNISTRMTRAAMMPTASVPCEAPGCSLNACPPTSTSKPAVSEASAALFTGAVSASAASTIVAYAVPVPVLIWAAPALS